MRFSQKSILIAIGLSLLAAAVVYRINENADDVRHVEVGDLLSNIQHEEVVLGSGERCEGLSTGCHTFKTKVVALHDDMPTVFHTLVDNILLEEWLYREDEANQRLANRQEMLDDLAASYDEAEEVAAAFVGREDAIHYFAIGLISDMYLERPRFLYSNNRVLLVTILRLDNTEDTTDNDFDSIASAFPLADDQVEVASEYLADNPEATLLGLSFAEIE